METLPLPDLAAVLDVRSDRDIYLAKPETTVFDEPVVIGDLTQMNMTAIGIRHLTKRGWLRGYALVAGSPAEVKEKLKRIGNGAVLALRAIDSRVTIGPEHYLCMMAVVSPGPAARC